MLGLYAIQKPLALGLRPRVSGFINLIQTSLTVYNYYISREISIEHPVWGSLRSPNYHNPALLQTGFLGVYWNECYILIPLDSILPEIVPFIIGFSSTVWTKKSAKTIRKQVRGICSYSPEVRTFGTLITSTKVFSLIIICNSLWQNDPLPRDFRRCTQRSDDPLPRNCRLHT